MHPLIDITVDGHVHTRLCNHAQGEMEEYVQHAIQRGLRVITFLEHLETDIHYQPRSWLEREEFDFYFAEGHRLRQVYGERINIRLGVELGYNPEASARVRERLARYAWDRVGLSCHFYRHNDSHLNLLSRRPESLAKLAEIGVDKVVTTYLAALTEAVQTIEADVVCHLDAVLRHYPGLSFTAMHRQQIETLLDAMRQHHVALEINTSGFDYRGTPFPAPWIITAALKRSIPLSAGSDAHRPVDVGRHFNQLPDYLARLVA